MTLANKITVSRIVTIPIFFILLLNQSFPWATLVGGLSGVTDALDGLVARKFKQQTPLGIFLDPLADKLFLLAAYGGLTAIHVTPVWVLVVILSKDLIVLMGWMLLFILTDSSAVTTRFLGKSATATQMLYAGTVLLSKSFESAAKITNPFLPFLLGAMVALTVISMLDYVIFGSKILKQSGHH
ncbi:MAG: CDP-alcohol phosphatidyltransferase family protein [Elusimicrobia bacterium]|nr:CDP-alcohol phosphatidyltransferase family protein [Elusimicrobiota bacterium]